MRLNGIDTAPATTPATIVASSRIPSTRQKSPLTSLTDRLIAAKTPRRSNTISGGAKLSTVQR